MECPLGLPTCYFLAIAAFFPFMAYSVISGSRLPLRGYPKHNWPLRNLSVGEAFVIEIAEGVDVDHRPESYIRTLIHKAGQRMGKTFSCRKTEDGDLAVIRTA